MQLSRKERERQNRESEVLKAAESLFSTKGFDPTTMDEIAKSSEFTKRTVYQYFGSKENLFYAVILAGVKDMFTYIDEGVAAGSSGLEKMRGARSALRRFMKERPEVYRLMGYTQYIKSDPKEIPNAHELSQYNRRLFALFQELLEEGMRDGSIRKDLKLPMDIYAIFFLTTGFMDRISEAGDAYARQYGVDADELIQAAFRMLDSLIGSGA